MKKFLVVIAGPTASGKTDLAVEVALHFKTEIISADSRQFFKELNIGTAKPTDQHLETVKHHFINFLSVHDAYDAGKYEEDVLKLLSKIFFEKNIAVLTGGSGLYIDAVCNGFDRLPERDENIRIELAGLLKHEGIQVLQEKLKELDEEYYSQVDLSNPQRMMRAIEVCILTGKKYSELRQHKKSLRNFSVVKIGLAVDRKTLYERINKRVDEMIRNGLIEEAKSLYSFRELNSLQTVGYKELFSFLDGQLSLDESIDLLKRNTRRYAKRQLTWFRKDNDIVWFNPEMISEMILHIQAEVEK
ncbi:MAG: tRNA (adenosine(37)-N6)-dimethylallyltransferase MiaA [Bacteroidia bacterium]|nr:tRNA (adenosine(37)-N6)-dimethylallyltransferase MiaA [Bacteroidia bacterium]